jgi:hypothetical protein
LLEGLGRVGDQPARGVFQRRDVRGAGYVDLEQFVSAALGNEEPAWTDGEEVAERHAPIVRGHLINILADQRARPPWSKVFKLIANSRPLPLASACGAIRVIQRPLHDGIENAVSGGSDAFETAVVAALG